MRKEVHCKHTRLQYKKQSSDTDPTNSFNSVVQRLLFTLIPAGFLAAQYCVQRNLRLCDAENGRKEVAIDETDLLE